MTSGFETSHADVAQVDTNGILRPLLDDDPDQSPRTHIWFELPPDQRPRLVVAASTLSEVIFVLAGQRLKFTRNEIVVALERIMEMPIEFDDAAVVNRAIELYRTVHDDWDDCFVAAYALEHNDGVVFSFDAGFDRIPGVTRIEPSQISA